MSKSLKEIVEEGFGSLELLAAKRAELLSRLSELSDDPNNQKCQQAIERLQLAENEYAAEIKEQPARTQEGFRQSLSQISEDNDRFLVSLRENLQLRISKILQELSISKEWILAASTQQLDSSIHPLEREVEASEAEIKTESVKFLGQLEAFCKESQSTLHEAQAEIAGKLSSSEHELSATLGSAFSSLVDESQQRRQNSSESLELLYKEQSSKMSTLTEEMDQRISLVVGKNLETVKALGKDADKALSKIKEDVLNSSYTQLVSATEESLTELRDIYEFSHHELSEKLTETQNQTEASIDQIRAFLNEQRDLVKATGEAFAEEICNRPEVIHSSDSSKTRLDESLNQMTRELDSVLSDLKRQLSELLRMQSDRLANISSSTESSISSSATALNTELKQLARLHDQTWGEREQDLLLKLRKVEKEAQETYARISGTQSQENGGSVN